MTDNWRARRRNRRNLAVMLTCDALNAAGLSATGYTIGVVAGVSFARLYATIDVLEQKLWMTSRWEHEEPLPDGRTRHRIYTVTDRGRDAIAQLCRRLSTPGTRH